VSRIYALRILETKAIFNQIMDQPFNFNVDDSVLLNTDNMAYPKDAQERAKRWEMLLKYRTIERYASLIEEREKNKGKENFVFKNDSTLEAESRAYIKKSYKKRVESFEKTFTKEKQFELFLNAITGVPHAIASIITIPKGSSHSIGINKALDDLNNLFFSISFTSPIYLICTSLVYLDLNNYQYLLDGLAASSNLKVLNISYNDLQILDLELFSKLAQVLKNCCNLEKLNLGDQDLAIDLNTKLPLLFNTLAKMPNLTKLNVSCGWTGYLGTDSKTLSNLLQISTSLKRLKLDYGYLDEEQQTKINQLLSAKPSIKLKFN
jgi:hypothetical protein